MLHLYFSRPCGIVCRILLITLQHDIYGANNNWFNWWGESSSPGELTPGKTWQWGPPPNGRSSNKRPSPQKEQGFRHLTPVLSANRARFQHPRASVRKKAWHVSVLICMWRVPELVTPSLRPSPSHGHIHAHIHSNLPLRLGICIVETAAKGTACLRERERKWEREHWGEGR